MFEFSCPESFQGRLARTAGMSRSARSAAAVATIVIALVALLLLSPLPASAQAPGRPGDVQTAWRLLDYMAVDYGGAVAGGKVKSASEYAEMTEFAASVTTRIHELPVTAARAGLLNGAMQLQQEVATKQSPDAVARSARGLAASLLAAYPVPVAPTGLPDLAHGRQLFATTCAACHGMTGDGHGPDAAKLATPPIAFTDAERARQRSVFALYQVITQGIDGTAMQSFADRPDADRWALAFRAGGFSFKPADVRDGERIWRSNPMVRARVPDIATLVQLTPAALQAQLGERTGRSVMAYLREHPEAVLSRAPASLDTVRSKLAASLAAYQAGQRPEAKELALSAYLDGFEPVEPTLGARDATLLSRIEGAMGEYRAAIDHGAPAEDLGQRAAVLGTLFDDAETALAPGASSDTATFVGAFTILLREGLEALLIVVAMIAFLRKADRARDVRYVQAGWVGALAAGAATWAVATYAIGISGASRELTEGFGSLFAAVVLLSVGIWMHGKAQADQWQRFIREKMGSGGAGSSGWMLFGLAFVVVYREVFETILFYAALWNQGNGVVLLAGAASACAVLAGTAWAMLRYSRTLPIGSFFRYSAWLMAILTVVLAGKGVAALQEAGIIGIAPLQGLPRVEILGLFPTWQSLLVQLAMLVAVGVGFVATRSSGGSGVVPADQHPGARAV